METAIAQDGLAATIRQHLAWFHSQMERTAILGWHVHLLPSLAFVVDDASPVPTDSQGDPLSEFGVPVAKIVAERAAVDSPCEGAGQFFKPLPVSVSGLTNVATSHCLASRPPLSFLSSLLPGARLRAITGVALC